MKTRNFCPSFEDRFRGPSAEVKLRLRVYVPFLEPFGAICNDRKAVDLGCGRGEWLEILRELGFDAVGIDLDDDKLAACRASGLHVEQREAVTYLKDLTDESMTVVSAFHLAEHMAFPDLQALVREAFRILRPAGVLIIETPNPENIVVGTSRFYLDPTHQRPLPPKLLAFLPEYYGFARTTILRLQDPPGLAQADSVGLLDVLGGVSPDYAVVAQKEAGAPGQAALFDAAFRAVLGLDLETLAYKYDQGLFGRLSDVASQTETNAELVGRNERDIARLEKELAQQQRALMQNQHRLAQLEQQLATLADAGARKSAAPPRWVAASARGVEKMRLKFVLWLKTMLKPVLVRAGAYVAARPALKARLMRVLRRLPGLHARLARVVRPGLTEAATARHAEGPQRVEDLTSSAKVVYQDLIDAGNARSRRCGPRWGTHGRANL